MFLFNPSPVAEKENSFRQAFSDEYRWFTEFIIGENHLKNGSRKEALQAYKRSYDAIPQSSQGGGLDVDSWLVGQVKTRLKEFNADDKPTEESEKQKAED
jgi:hypothetical protein